jgi:hypothetical protein
MIDGLDTYLQHEWRIQISSGLNSTHFELYSIDNNKANMFFTAQRETDLVTLAEVKSSLFYYFGMQKVLDEFHAFYPDKMEVYIDRYTALCDQFELLKADVIDNGKNPHVWGLFAEWMSSHSEED